MKLKLASIANKAKAVIETASEVAQAVNNWGATPSLRNYLAAGAIGVNKVVEWMGDFDLWSDSSLRQCDFVPYQFREYLRAICRKHPTSYHSNPVHSMVQVSEVYGHTVYFTMTQGTDIQMWYKVEDLNYTDKEMLTVFGRAIWEETGSNAELVGVERNLRHSIAIKSWDKGAIYDSPQAKVVLERTVALMDTSNRCRSVLLKGVPGTGKSCMIKHIAHHLTGTVLFIDAQQIQNISGEDLSFILDVLVPDIVLLDDLDRVWNTSFLISTIDHLSTRVKLLLATANHMEYFDGATIRPERFDDIIEVSRVVPAKELVSIELPEEIAEEIETWPVSFVKELNTRLNTFGADRLEQEFSDLRSRVESNDKKSEVPPLLGKNPGGKEEAR